jgi:hypothetical protein
MADNKDEVEETELQLSHFRSLLTGLFGRVVVVDEAYNLKSTFTRTQPRCPAF